jgi:hypothetical protein
VKTNRAGQFALLAGFLRAANPAFAHHEGSIFDLGRSVTLEATVIDYLSANPHVMIYASAKDNKGAVQKWTIELRGSPTVAPKVEWSKDTIKPGEELTFVGHPAKNGAESLRLAKVVLPNGMELYPEMQSWFSLGPIRTDQNMAHRGSHEPSGDVVRAELSSKHRQVLSVFGRHGYEK